MSSIVCHKVGIDDQIRIRNWAEHWSMLMSATASESCSTIAFIDKKYDIPKAHVDLQIAL